MNLKRIRLLLMFLTVVLFNVLLLSHIEEKVLQINCFQIETAYRNLRNHAVSQEVLADFFKAADGDMQEFAGLLAMYFATDGAVADTEILEQDIAFVRKYREADFLEIRGYVFALWNDLVCFPVGAVTNATPIEDALPGGNGTSGFTNDEEAAVTFADSWMQSRTFGGDRGHEGCDIMAAVNKRGIYPIYSMTDGAVENIGWLRLGGYRIGIRSDSGAYFYYAHLAEYAKDFEIGERVKAGTHLGYMGDTGYSDIPGTTGNFDVHLHLGMYLNDAGGNEFSVNSYPMLRYLWERQDGLR